MKSCGTCNHFDATSSGRMGKCNARGCTWYLRVRFKEDGKKCEHWEGPEGEQVATIPRAPSPNRLPEQKELPIWD